MANISVNDIQPTGAELFSDLEGFMDELDDGEFNSVVSGGHCTAVAGCNCTTAAGCYVEKKVAQLQELVAVNIGFAQPELFAAEYISSILG